MRILIAEDQPQLNRSLTKALTAAGWSVDAVSDGGEALLYLDGADYDAVVLDIMMPKVDGLTVLRTLRARGGAVPVLLLTARDTVSDRVAGLDAGADDYLIKPFALGGAAGPAPGTDPQQGQRPHQHLYAGRPDGGHRRPHRRAGRHAAEAVSPGVCPAGVPHP